MSTALIKGEEMESKSTGNEHSIVFSHGRTARVLAR